MDMIDGLDYRHDDAWRKLSIRMIEITAALDKIALFKDSRCTLAVK
jgi:hypothetical protein